MVAVKTGFSSPSMPGMPAPMQPMGGLPPMPPMGGPGTFPAAPLPAGQTPIPPSMPPMPLAGMPPPPMRPPMAQQGSNAPRRRRFGDSLENMLGRNQGLGATAPQRRPLPMPQQQRMVAPGMPMMRTPTPRPMAMGGEVDIFGYEDASSVPRQTNIAGQPHMLSYINQDEEALLRSFGGSGIAGPGGIPSYPPSEYSAGQGSGYTTGTGSSNFDSGYTSSASKRRKKAAKAAALAEAKAAAIQQIKDAEAAALAAQQTPSGKMDFGDEDYTPTSAALNQQLANQGLTNITTNFSPVDYTTTGSNNNFTTAAQADTGVSGAEFVAAGGLGSVDSSTPASPPPVTLGSTEALPAPVENPPLVVYTDMVGNTHNSAAERDMANLGIQQQMYGSGNQAARNVQQELYRQYAERFPEGKRMEGDSEKLGQMAADTYLEYAPQINELLGPQGLPNQPFNLPFSFSGIESIKPSGSEDSPDQSSQVDNNKTPAGTERFGKGFPYTKKFPNEFITGLDNMGIPSGPDVGLGLGSDYPDMSMTAIPGATTPDDIKPEIISFPRSSFGQVDLGKPGNRGFTPEGTQIAPEAATIFGMTPEEQAIVGGMSAVPGAGSAVTPEELSIIGGMSAVPTAGSAVTPEELNIMSGMSAVPGAGQKITSPKAGSSNRTGVDPQADQYRSSVNAAEAAYLQEALGNMDDPNFAEQVINKIIRNLTFNMYDPDDPQKRADANAILKAYEDTGKFVYDTEENAIDLSKSYKTPEGKAAFDKLMGLSKGAGIEPAVTGVRDKEGNVVDFDDGTGFRNIMGDFDYKKGIGSDTQNILTGSTDVFGSNTNTDNTATPITTGGGDDNDTTDTTVVDTGHTTDKDGNKVCNQEGYIYNPETKICEPKKEEEEVDGTPGSGIGTGTSGESFDDVLKRVVMAAPDVAPISANVKPMQEGGMVGLNRAADNFLQALAG